MSKKPHTKQVFISAVNGQYVKEAYAAKHPDKTVKLTVQTGR